MITTHPRLTGERPQQGVTPDSLLSLHDAGYREVLARLGTGLVLDVGTGEGFESARLAGEGRRVLGVDYSEEAVVTATRVHGDRLLAARMDACSLGLADGAVDWACSSHLIEHFADPSPHVAEMARVLGTDGAAFVLTPNAPADFENPFHLRLFRPDELGAFLERWFVDVTVMGLDASARVKEDFAARRAKAARLLRLDVLDLRHRMPRGWYVGLYTRLLPIAYRFLERRRGVTAGTGGGGGGGAGAGGGITAEEWFVSERIDDTTPVLFAVCRGPRRADGGAGR
ncbi:MAG: class I SAM-dependent methyltransferase [Acidimicrobiales bacterium]